MSISREELAELTYTRDKLCDFFENYDACEKCQVTLLDQAYSEYSEDCDE